MVSLNCLHQELQDSKEALGDSIMPKHPETASVGLNSNGKVRFGSSDRNIRDHLIDLLLFASKKSHFVFDGDYYITIKSMASHS